MVMGIASLNPSYGARPPVRARPARESRAGPAPTIPGWHGRRSGPCPRWSGIPARIADEIRSYAAPPAPFPCRSAPCARIAGRARSYNSRMARAQADLVRDGRAYRRGSRMRSAPTLLHLRRSPVGAHPARDFVGRAREVNTRTKKGPQRGPGEKPARRPARGFSWPGLGPRPAGGRRFRRGWPGRRWWTAARSPRRRRSCAARRGGSCPSASWAGA